jgi:hypothetical protein
MNTTPAILQRPKQGMKPPRVASIHPSAFIIHPLIAPLSPQTPSHPVPAPRPRPTRPGPLKSNFLSDLRSDAKKDLDGYLIDLIGRPSTLQEEEEYFTQLRKAEYASSETTTDGTTVGRVLQDADRMLIAANVAKKALKGMDIEELSI